MMNFKLFLRNHKKSIILGTAYATITYALLFSTSVQHYGMEPLYYIGWNFPIIVFLPIVWIFITIVPPSIYIHINEIFIMLMGAIVADSLFLIGLFALSKRLKPRSKSTKLLYMLLSSAVYSYAALFTFDEIIGFGLNDAHVIIIKQIAMWGNAFGMPTMVAVFTMCIYCIRLIFWKRTNI